MTTAARCLDCQSALGPDQRFCAQCGQRASTGRLTIHEIGHDLMHAFVHVDRGVLPLLRGLLTRPGHVAREYVRGARRRYFGPFAFLVVAVALSAFLAAVSGYPVITSSAAQNPVVAFLQSHPNLLFLAQVPLLAAWSRLFLLRAGDNYAEHLVLAAYTVGMRAVVFALVNVPVWVIFRPVAQAALLVQVYTVAWILYFAWATMQFRQGNRFWGFAGGLAAALAMKYAGTALINGFVALT
jgi:Protein of unknown function (DUF3667)